MGFKVPKTILKIIFSAILTSYFLLLNPNPIAAKDYSFPQVNFQVQINKDGSFDVQEKRTYTFTGEFSWADMWLPLEIQSSNVKVKPNQISFLFMEATNS